MSSQKFSLPLRFSGSENNLWVEYIQLAQEYKPLNLGQGFPDFAPPEFLTKALAEVANGDNVLLHQYTGCFGHHRLVVALSKYYSQLIGRELNPKTEIIVTSGAFQAVFNCIQGHTSPGDEIIIIEPFFDCYEPMVRAVGGVPVFIPLRLVSYISVSVSKRCITQVSGDYSDQLFLVKEYYGGIRSAVAFLEKFS
ncbi:Kynurenine--oxoglutarate transaminase 3 [Homalodisca vitripennis]|nr:Kynurenine--oxoglutarate transaminase 3 [Homalodisca vitripennis]